MGLFNIIRTLRLRYGPPIRVIARRTGSGRNMSEMYVNAGKIEPAFAAPERPSKLDAFADKLPGWLKTEARKARRQPRSQKLMHADLVARGVIGSYNRVAVLARKLRADSLIELQTTGRGAFVPLLLRQGEAFQFGCSKNMPF